MVATPLGNLGDLTARARDTLAQADLIAAEDTRVTAVLLAHYGIVARVTALHEHNERQKTPALLAELAAGRSVALVSDAGTPAISDPGARLVRAAREAGYRVVPIPGPSALTTALSAAGLDAGEVLFAGFLPVGGEGAARNAGASRPTALRTRVLRGAAPRARDRGRARRGAGSRARCWSSRASSPRSTRRSPRCRLPTLRRGSRPTPIGSAASSCCWSTLRRLPASVPSLPIDADRLLDALLAELPPAKAARVAAAATGLSRDELYARAVARRGG